MTDPIEKAWELTDLRLKPLPCLSVWHDGDDCSECARNKQENDTILYLRGEVTMAIIAAEREKKVAGWVGTLEGDLVERAAREMYERDLDHVKHIADEPIWASLDDDWKEAYRRRVRAVYPLIVATLEAERIGWCVHRLVTQRWDEVSAVRMVAWIESLFAEDKPNG